MLTSEFAFFRGAAAIMAGDLALSHHTRLTVQLCGDAHLSNFGGYASPERNFVFDVNDFDETLPGPFEWDVKRLVASFAVAGRSRGFDAVTRERIARRVVKAYRENVQRLSMMSRLEVWYSRLSLDDVASYLGSRGKIGKGYRKAIKHQEEKALSQSSEKAMRKLTATDSQGRVRFESNPPFVVPLRELVAADEAKALTESVQHALAQYRRSLISDRRVLLSGYRVVDVARKMVGVGSVGNRSLVALLMADNDESDVLMLQVKQAGPSVHEAHLPKSRASSHGERVVEGQRVMQADSDIMLGWTQAAVADEKYDFYVRQMWDWKESFEVESMDDKAMEVHAYLCGWTLARSHARSGDRIALAGYLGTSDRFDTVMADFAEEYADQNAQDYAELQKAASDGRIQVAESGW
jgi:uncharacterized protein (DUF2252 family)